MSIFVHGIRRYLMTCRISTSLCRIIFESPKVNDVLSFMTILSTDLKVLKQRGYNGALYTPYHPQMANLFVIHRLVERILPRHMAERREAENAEREEVEKAKREEGERVRIEKSASFILNLPEMMLYDTQTIIPITQTNIPLPPIGTVIAGRPPPPNPGSTSLGHTSKHSSLTSAIQKLEDLHRNHPDVASSRLSFPPPSPPEGLFMLAKPGSSREVIQSSQPDPTFNSLSDIGTSLKFVVSGFD